MISIPAAAPDWTAASKPAGMTARGVRVAGIDGDARGVLVVEPTGDLGDAQPPRAPRGRPLRKAADDALRVEVDEGVLGAERLVAARQEKAEDDRQPERRDDREDDRAAVPDPLRAGPCPR